ncbi:MULTISPECIES: LuxR C-terminal-related transcriptional regulator [unclassified Rhodococcus (in: high G+C Gram-positive bacteria)]|uniref:helix-turn-helix transcriptional regulator n=1 Tax=unclassified Rhodococcus (in: high G+C Gram-positive bacteria) TaxID=192944 RepID=UPI0016397A31|nr:MULTISPECIES: LuxR C-terminal-related transcriptional regulator [unclassified Rhodococcus (in: high G+C Gram-positive bacteria)]MBC2640698.1 helix-turn-helix transcriptional regulator [Rhodococcus sp. 3A]MBC2894557.1 helix-turn-helix transcriptional regulator [Rhodococcus sp. 4CII]
MRSVIAGPLPKIAARFSRFLAGVWPHDALVIFTRECTGRPRKVAGAREIVDRVTIDELDDIKRAIDLGETFDGIRSFGGGRRRIWAVRDAGDTLLVLVPKRSSPDAPGRTVAALFGMVATSIQQQVAQASPDYLAESRAASSERARTIAELTEVHEATLSSILGTLRSHDLDDRRSRITASETASAALIALRSAGAADRALSEEAVTTAFARLQGELRPLLRHRDVDLEYIDPPADGRPLPGEVAHAARAMVRAIVLAFGAQPVLARLRIAWDCDGDNVLIEVRDQGPGAIDEGALTRQLAGRLQTLRGRIDIESITGWGSRVMLTIPLDPPAARPDEHLLSTLNPRELEVLAHLGAGKRNRAIAEHLGISESTIKFHVAGVLKKLDVANRGEAGAIGIRAGIVLGAAEAGAHWNRE